MSVTPVLRVDIPVRVPFGFHGKFTFSMLLLLDFFSWIPGLDQICLSADEY